MSSFEDDPYNRIESYPCSCGGNITKDEDNFYWQCDKCNFKRLIYSVKTEKERKKIDD